MIVFKCIISSILLRIDGSDELPHIGNALVKRVHKKRVDE